MNALRGAAAALFAAAAIGCHADGLLSTHPHDSEASLAAPTALAQKSSSRGFIQPANTVELSAAVEALSPDALVAMDVEVRPAGAPFTGDPTRSSAPTPSGERASVTLSSEETGAAFHWRARARDDAGRMSAWRAYSGRSGSIGSGNP